MESEDTEESEHNEAVDSRAVIYFAITVIVVGYFLSRVEGKWHLFLNCCKFALLIIIVVILIIAAVILYTWYALRGLRRCLNRRDIRRDANQIGSALRSLSSFLSWMGNLNSQLRNSRNSSSSTTSNTTLVEFVLGQFLDPKKSQYIWKTENFVVGSEAILSLGFYRKNGMKWYQLHTLKNLKCVITVNNEEVVGLIERDPTRKQNYIDIHFIPIISGRYKIVVFDNATIFTKNGIFQEFLPGPVDTTKSYVSVPSHVMVVQQGLPEAMVLEEQDKYGNQCLSPFEDLCKYVFSVTDLNGIPINPTLSFSSGSSDVASHAKNQAWLQVNEAGVYHINVTYNNVIIAADIILLVLTEKEIEEVNRNVSQYNWNLYYEAYIYTKKRRRISTAPITNSTAANSSYSPLLEETVPNDHLKKKTVYCFLCPKMFTVKEYYLKIIPKTLCAMRINSIKITISEEDENGARGLNIVSGNKSIVVYSQSRHMILGTLVKMLLKNIGGSEDFEEKRKYFHKELLKMKPTMVLPTCRIDVRRAHILSDTLQRIKTFSTTDWWRKVEVTFVGEQGIDYGGLTREWMQVLLNELLHTKGALFRKFNTQDSQGLIHPNHYRSEKYKKLHLFKVLGWLVAKCLIESAYSTKRQMFVKARFTRSFLSQIVGFGVNWKHFAMDDKEFYNGKIKYILENDPKDLELYFTEDVYGEEGKLVKTVDLKYGGSRIEVTEDNKYEYIQKLSDMRLSETVREEITYFLKGLYSLVPEKLLSIFTVSELELLICGLGNINVTDMKNNVEVPGNENSQTIRWFWTVVSSFNQEELSRLLQFTTGCAQLPPEGFGGLNPKFKITINWSVNALPTAHTCFNNLSLPKYTSIDELRSKLLIAITDFNEEFGLA